ncbi:hypothetical protein [Rahnella sp. GSA61A]|uniref:hypothetical protein n=1 Tax=Rahnella sp. GSA61A TaxID=2862678 RepID=UPI001CC0C3C8|nr:hypothetical protein [Rahnella sp. GSA61A]
MKTRFYFDEETFLSNNFCSDGAFAAHDNLMQEWNNYGVLVIPPNRSIEDYYNAINQIPPKFRKRWQEAFVKFHKSSTGKNINYISTYKSIDALEGVSEDVETFLIPYELSGNIGLNEFGVCMHTSQKFEVIESSSILSSFFFKRSKLASQKNISNTDTADIIWNERMRNLSKNEKKIIISDRYFLENVMKDVTHTKKNDNILFNLIKLISQDNELHSLKIYTSGGDKNSDLHMFIENYLREYLKKKSMFSEKLSLFELFSVDEKVFKNDGHDRYIRFGNYVCEVGLGMEIFRTNNFRSTTFNIKDISFTYNKELEKEMNKNRKWTYSTELKI